MRITDKEANTDVEVQIVCAQRGAWYYLIDGTLKGREVTANGGESWFSTERIAKQEARHFIKTCYWHSQYGFVL